MKSIKMLSRSIALCLIGFGFSTAFADDSVIQVKTVKDIYVTVKKTEIVEAIKKMKGNGIRYQDVATNGDGTINFKVVEFLVGKNWVSLGGSDEGNSLMETANGACKHLGLNSAAGWPETGRRYDSFGSVVALSSAGSIVGFGKYSLGIVSVNCK